MAFFSLENYILNGWALPPFLTAWITLATGLVVIGREEFSRTGQTFFGFCLSIFVWLVGFSGLYSTSSSHVAMRWCRIIYLGVPCIPATCYHFANALIGKEQERSRWIVLTWVISGLFVWGAWSTNWFVVDVYSYWWGYYPAFGWLGSLFIGFFAVVMSTVLFQFGFIRHDSIENTRARALSTWVLVSLFVGTIAASDFLPVYGVEIYPVGYAFILAMMSGFTYSVWNYKMEPLTVSYAARPILTTMDEAVVVCDPQGRIASVNPECESLLGPVRKVQGSHLDDLLGETSGQKTDGREGLTGRSFQETEVSIQAPDGSERIVQVRKSSLSPEAEEEVGAVYVLHDITRQKKLQRQLEHHALHDQLTDLPNRALFRNRCQTALEKAGEDGEYQLAVAIADVDDFKQINDMHGHQAGDAALKAVARRWSDVLRPGDTVARWGGDEFAVLLEGERASETDAIMKRLRDSLNEPIEYRDTSIDLSVSFGLTLCSSGDETVESIIQQADWAMYSAKDQGGDRWVRFNKSMKTQFFNQRRKSRELEKAFQEDQFSLHYQPIVDIESFTITGWEALVRWDHPEDGIRRPSEFLPLAKETGCLFELDRWALKTVCRTASEWHNAREKPNWWIAVNWSVSSFLDPDATNTVRTVLEETGCPVEALHMEVTETSAIETFVEVKQSLRRLRKLGVRLSLDDFGTGYSTLKYLQQLPAGILKVDRSFVSGLDEQNGDLEIVEGSLNLAQALEKQVIIEGVENARQLQRIRNIGCRYAQGFLFHRPVPRERVAEARQAIESTFESLDRATVES